MIELPFNSQEFVEAWQDWLEYKRLEFKFQYKSPQSMKAALKKLNGLANQDEQTAIKIINESMANGWKGLFALKEEKKQNLSINQKMSEAHAIVSNR